MKKNGFAKAGTQRWRCKACGGSKVVRNDTTSRRLRSFVSWPPGKLPQSELATNARTFREHTRRFWRIWPILPVCDEVHHVVHVDGVRLSRKCVILIACTDDRVIGCHLAKTENSKDRACLTSRVAPPDALVRDGGGGIEGARRGVWPNTRVQRCVFHVFCQVRRCTTTTRPKTQAGVDLYALAKELMHVDTLQGSAEWPAAFHRWCIDYEEFLKERADDGGRFKHERLRKAGKALVALCNAGTLFTHLDEGLVAGGPVPSTSNRIENLDGRIRRMLQSHRGMSIDHRIKAVFWFCYMQSECPVGYAAMLDAFPDDDKVREWRTMAAEAGGDETGAPARWGEGLVWSELHHATPYPYAID